MPKGRDVGRYVERMGDFSRIHIYTLLQGRVYDRHLSACTKPGGSTGFRSCAEGHFLNPLRRLAAKRIFVWRIFPCLAIWPWPVVSDVLELRDSQPNYTGAYRNI